MPTGEAHRLARAVHKAERNARARARRRRGLTPVVSWERFRCCTGCGRWVSESQTAGHGDGYRYCDPCALAADLRRTLARVTLTVAPAPGRRAA